MSTNMPPPSKPRASHRFRGFAPLIRALLTLLFVFSLAPSVAADPFDYRSGIGAPLWVDDWSDNPLADMTDQGYFDWGGWPLHFVNTRAMMLSEDDRNPDAALVSGACQKLAYNSIHGIKYRWPNAARAYADRHEFTYAHSTDPASLHGVLVKQGSDDVVELHWEIDDRLLHLMDGSTWNDPVGFPDYFTDFEVYGMGPGEADFSLRATVSAINGRCSWSEVVTTSGTYRYRIMTLWDADDPVDYSQDLEMDITIGDPDPLPIWVNSLWGLHPNPVDDTNDEHVLHVNLGAYHDPAQPLVLACDVKRPGPNAAEAWVYKVPLSLTYVDGDYHEYALDYTWAEPSGGKEALAPFVCRFFIDSGGGFEDVLNGSVYTTAPCNRLRNSNWWTYLGDVNSDDYVTAWALRSAEIMGTDYDGIFGDAADHEVAYYWWTQPEGYVAGTYPQQVSDFIQAIRATPELAGKALIGNGSTWEQNPIYEHLDGVVYEDFISKRGEYCLDDGESTAVDGDIYSGSHWICNMESFVNILTGSSYPGKSAYMWPYFEAQNTRSRMFTYASFLLGAWSAPERAFYSARNVGPEAGHFHMQAFAEQMIGLGQPTGGGPTLPEFPPGAGCVLHTKNDVPTASPCDDIPDDCSTFNDFDLVVADYEGGIVAVNFNHWCTEFDHVLALPGGETFHQLHIDQESVFDGGRFWTTPVTDSIVIAPLTGVILLREPIASPVVATSAESPLTLNLPQTHRLRIAASFWNGEPGWVEADPFPLTDSHDTVVLTDPDGDGVYESDPLSLTTGAGTYPIEFYARGNDGLGLYDVFEVTVHDQPLAKYVDASSETGMAYSGRPYSSVTLDYDGDGLTDMFISVQDDVGQLYQSLWLNLPSFVPTMSDVNNAMYEAGSDPGVALRGISTADIDNDGHPDLLATGEGNARLWMNKYNGDTGGRIFSDQASTFGLTTLLADTWSGVWADYDRDLDLDLYVTRAQTAAPGITEPTPNTLIPLPDRLLRNDLSDSGHFTDVSTAAEGMTTASYGTLGACWADFDADGDQDLFVPSLMDVYGSETARLYVNQDDGTFTEEFGDRFGNANLFWVSGAEWFDANNDGELDLVASVQGPGPAAQRLFIQDQGLLVDAMPGLTMEAAGVKAFDFDLDGKQDLLFLPALDTGTPRLLNNFSSPGASEFLDVTSLVGLDVPGRVNGAVVSDFNTGNGSAASDGDLDLYLGRRVADGDFFFQATDKDGNAAPLNSYISIRLVPTGANTSSAIGTMVRADYGGKSQIQQLDGGSGRGGQGDGVLTFGLGDHTGDVLLTVRWPGGGSHERLILASELNPDQPIQISDETDPVIEPGALQCQSTLLPDGQLECTVSWFTATSSTWSLDRVEAVRPGLPLRTFAPSDPDATFDVEPVSGGGYRHRLVFSTPCSLGDYKYRALSATENKVGNWSEQIVVRNLFCPRGGGVFPEQ